MKSRAKKFGYALFAVAFAVSMMLPAALLAQIDPIQASAQEPEGTQISREEAVVPEAATTETQDEPDQESANPPATGLTAIIYYVELVNSDDPDHGLTIGDARLMGTRVLTDLTEGDVLHAWDYVEDIPGYFFFDGYPRYLTISTDESKNYIELDYGNLSNSQFTVNYYLMTGADLTADTWSEALEPDEVTFTKMGTSTFTGRPASQLIQGDAYEYKLNDLYVIDSYPSEIVLDPNPENNVLNVLYTPAADLGPEDVLTPDTPTAPDPSPIPPATGDIPDETPDTPSDTVTPDAPDAPATTLPDGSVLTEDEVVSLLPAGSDSNPELINDFVGDPRTDMGAPLTQTGDENASLFAALSIAAGAAVAVIIVALFLRRKDAAQNGPQKD